MELLGGSRLGLSKFVIDDQQKCHLHNEVLGEVVLPIDAIRAVRFSSGEAAASFAQAADEKSDEDRVFVKLGGGLEPIGGLIRIAYSKNELRQVLPQIDQVLARLQNSQLDVVNETALLLESCRLILKTIDDARLASVVKALDELDAKRPGMINTISSTALVETLSR